REVGEDLRDVDLVPPALVVDDRVVPVLEDGALGGVSRDLALALRAVPLVAEDLAAGVEVVAPVVLELVDVESLRGPAGELHHPEAAVAHVVDEAAVRPPLLQAALLVADPLHELGRDA